MHFSCRLQPIRPKSTVTPKASASTVVSHAGPDAEDEVYDDDVSESRPSTALSEFSAVTQLDDTNTGKIC